MSRESGILYVGNLPGDIRQQEVEELICNGHKIEKSVSDVTALVSGTETACSVSSVNGSVPDTKEIILHEDDNEKSLEMEQSSVSNDSFTPVVDSGITLRPIESDGNDVDITGEDEAEYTSPPIKNVVANTHEVIKPQTGNSDKVATESVEDALDLTAEQGTEHMPSCLTENVAATTKEVTEHRTEVEYLEGSVSSLVSCSRLQHMTEHVNDSTVVGGDCTSSSSTDRLITSMDFELESSCPQSSENTEEFYLVANSSIVQRAVGSNETVIDSASECETNCKASMDNVATNTREIVETEMGDADNAAVGCVEDGLVLTTKHGQEPVSSCLTGNVVSTVRDVIEQETEVENLEGVVSNSLSCLELKPITDDINDTAVTGGDITSCSMDRASGSVDFELETAVPQSFESTNVLTVVADSNIVQRPLGSDESILLSAREHETECKGCPSVENVTDHTHEIIELETGDAANVAVECVEDALVLTTEHGTEQVSSCLTGNDAFTVTKVIEQETEVENHETSVSTPVKCLKLNPTEDVSGNYTAGGDSTNCLIDKVVSSMDFEVETPCNQSSESSDSLTVVAITNIVQRPAEIDECDLGTTRKHETQCRASPSIENVAANTHEIIKPETGDADNVAVGCVKDAPVLSTECGTEQVSFCSTESDSSTATEVIEQETEVHNFERTIEAVNDTNIAGDDSTTDKMISSTEIEFEETPDPKSSESTNSLMFVADTNIVQTPVEIDDGKLDTARNHETQYRASLSMENVAANTHEIITPETGDADNVAVGCVKDAPVLSTECGTEQVSFCLTESDSSTATEVIEQETEVHNFKRTIEAVNDTNIAGDDNSTDKMISSTEIEFEETPDPKSSESTNSLMFVADTNIVQTPVEIDDGKLDTARNHETQYRASLSMENVAANTHEISKPETGDADNVAVGYVEDAPVFATECGTEQVPSCLTGNDASTLAEVTEQEMNVDNFEGAVSTPVSCLKLKPIVNDIVIAGVGNTSYSTEIGLEETPDPQSSESINSLTIVADTNIVKRPVERDETSLNTLSKHETEYKDSPSMENVTVNTHEIIKPEIEDSDKPVVECVEDVLHPTIEQGSEHLFSCLTENEAPTSEDLIEQEAEIENFEGAVSSPANFSKLKPIGEDVNHSTIAGGGSPTCSTDKVITCMEFDPEISRARDVSTLQVDNDHLKPKISIVDDVPTVPFGSKKEFEVGNHSVISSGKDMLCGDVSSESEVSDSFVTKDKLPNCILDNLDKESKGVHLAGAHVNSDDKLICQVTNEVENSLKNGKSTSLLGNSSAGAVALHDVVEPLTRPFHYLIRMPRFEDSKMREQIRKAQLLVEEKTQHRDAFRIEVQKYKANCLGYAAEYEAAMSESRTLKKSVKSKRAEIDSLQSVMNKVKNAITVDEVDSLIHKTEHMIEHETLPLKQEKQLICDIKRMKQAREQLSSNIGSHDELQQALNNRDQIEERLKVLKKELESLKDSVVKADAVVRALEKKYEDENRKVKEVQTRYAAANNVRQDAYAHLQSLRRQLFEKNQRFHMYKDSAAAASDFAAKQDREGLHHLCVNQVERIMELWNQNNEFREEYVRCNMKSTLRRLGTMDGRSLGPNEQPHVFTSYGGERANQLVCEPSNSSVNSQMENSEQDGSEPIQNITVGGKIKVKEPEQQIPATGPGKLEKHVLRNDLATASGREMSENVIREVQHMPTQEELDVARKVDKLRKEEAEANLREQRRLEERAKALEALERKKRNAEKAQMRAELRAQKEAEHREKEKEKRLRKKERRKGGASEVSDGSNSTETTLNCESMSETMREPETKENPVAVSKRPQKVSQFTKQSKAKSIPPPLRNRGRRKLQQWMWVILTCVLVVALFLLGNVGFFSNLSNLRRRNSGF